LEGIRSSCAASASAVSLPGTLGEPRCILCRSFFIGREHGSCAAAAPKKSLRVTPPTLDSIDYPLLHALFSLKHRAGRFRFIGSPRSTPSLGSGKPSISALPAPSAARALNMVKTLLTSEGKVTVAHQWRTDPSLSLRSTGIDQADPKSAIWINSSGVIVA